VGIEVLERAQPLLNLPQLWWLCPCRLGKYHQPTFPPQAAPALLQHYACRTLFKIFLQTGGWVVWWVWGTDAGQAG